MSAECKFGEAFSTDGNSSQESDPFSQFLWMKGHPAADTVGWAYGTSMFIDFLMSSQQQIKHNQITQSWLLTHDTKGVKFMRAYDTTL